jgi:hypothetical protein
MSTSRHEHSDLKSFLDALEREGIHGVGLRSVREIRPRQLDKYSVEVALQQWVELTAYKQGVLHFAKLPGASGSEIEAQLKERGLTVRSRSDNLT